MNRFRAFDRTFWPGIGIAAVVAAATYFSWPDRAACLYRDATGAVQLRC